MVKKKGRAGFRHALKRYFEKSTKECHCEERSDVAISWYDLSGCCAVLDIVPGDSHVGPLDLLGMT